MKRLCFLFAMLTVTPINAAQIVNVDYIVKYTKQKWDVDVPHNPEQIRWAANMEYLLGVVDWVNKQNGFDTSYGTGPYATRIAVDTIAANKAIDELIKKPDKKYECDDGAKFCFIPETDGNLFRFTISAAGTFTINWGDGQTKTVTRSGTSSETYSHTYQDSANTYHVSLDGVATAYSTGTSTAAISFSGADNSYRVKSVSGCLSCVFPYLSATSTGSPRFYETFKDNTALTSVPDTLFENLTTGGDFIFNYTFYNSGLTSVPPKLFKNITSVSASMFRNTFRGCTGLKTVPAGLFSHITSGAEYLFAYTFKDSGLTSVPADLFSGITSDTRQYMFSDTFYGCTGLKTVPANLFGRITQGETRMFQSTFSYSGLTSAPDGLFNGISSGASYMFAYTFSNCTQLKTVGDILPNLEYSSSYPSGLFYEAFYNAKALTNTLKIGQDKKELWDVWSPSGQGTYGNDLQLPNYGDIPSGWK